MTTVLVLYWYNGLKQLNKQTDKRFTSSLTTDFLAQFLYLLLRTKNVKYSYIQSGG